MKKKPRFFCDNCGSEVDRYAKTCPHCGRFFASVRCPACGFAGEERFFAKGCPSCGYSAPPSGTGAPLHGNKAPPRPLPLWVYILSISALIAVFAVLLALIMNK